MDVRQRILEAAFRLVLESGISALTQPRVARAAGLRQSHLTYYFPTRAKLLQAVVQHSMKALVQQLGDAGRSQGPRSAPSLARTIGDAIADGRRARMMLALIVASDEDPQIKTWLRRFVRTLRADLARLLRAGGLDPSRAALLHTMLVGAAILNVARDDSASRREARQSVRAALTLLAAPKSRRPPSTPATHR